MLPKPPRLNYVNIYLYLLIIFKWISVSWIALLMSHLLIFLRTSSYLTCENVKYLLLKKHFCNFLHERFAVIFRNTKKFNYIEWILATSPLFKFFFSFSIKTTFSLLIDLFDRMVVTVFQSFVIAVLIFSLRFS